MFPSFSFSTSSTISSASLSLTADSVLPASALDAAALAIPSPLTDEVLECYQLISFE